MNSIKASSLPPCAFCGRQTSISEDGCAVMHELPTCAKFDAMSAADYLRACGEHWNKETEKNKRRTHELNMLLEMCKTRKFDFGKLPS